MIAPMLLICRIATLVYELLIQKANKKNVNGTGNADNKYDV